MSSIGDRMQQWREHLGLTQPQMSQLTSIPLSTWKGYELNKRTPGGDALAALAATGVNVNWLLTGEGKMLIEEQFSPSEFSEINLKFRELENILAKIEDSKRSAAINEMIGRAKEAFRLSELERLVDKLQKTEEK